MHDINLSNAFEIYTFKIQPHIREQWVYNHNELQQKIPWKLPEKSYSPLYLYIKKYGHDCHVIYNI